MGIKCPSYRQACVRRCQILSLMGIKYPSNRQACVWRCQILSLIGIKYLYSLNVFLYSMFAFVLLALVWLLVAPAAKWKRLTKDEKLEAAYAT